MSDNPQTTTPRLFEKGEFLLQLTYDPEVNVDEVEGNTHSALAMLWQDRARWNLLLDLFPAIAEAPAFRERLAEYPLAGIQESLAVLSGTDFIFDIIEQTTLTLGGERSNIRLYRAVTNPEDEVLLSFLVANNLILGTIIDSREDPEALGEVANTPVAEVLLSLPITEMITQANLRIDASSCGAEFADPLSGS